MTALLDFNSMMRLLILLTCTITYIKPFFPQQLRNNLSSKENTSGMNRLVYIGIVVGERLSLYVSLICFYYGIQMLVRIFI
ncbi:hypothetical protein NEOKW01_2068 [Nematocida sp. AWRm80]|nr:hypothetical protein NEOKW01_2068 [Nematocida sp. AWRm80]